MPVYDYKCQTHGVFYELAAFEDSGKPCACPECGELSARIILVAPEIFKMAPNAKKAHEINEKNQHEPVFSSQERRELDQQHAQTCACTKRLNKTKLLFTSRGEKMFPSMRPWMISH
jgi:putative FmdB family regulatory protein